MGGKPSARIERVIPCEALELVRQATVNERGRKLAHAKVCVCDKVVKLRPEQTGLLYAQKVITLSV